jgi:hypothetical protein
MNPTDQDRWLNEHIPHRLRACLADLRFQEEIMPTAADEKTRAKIRALCLLTAAWEGRMAGMRWLIEFVGVAADSNGKPRPPNPHPTDISMTCIHGGQKIDLSSDDAAILAKVWLGCSQASGHPTQDSNHPPVHPKALDKAIRIIVTHLKRTIYSADPNKLLAETFRWPDAMR